MVMSKFTNIIKVNMRFFSIYMTIFTWKIWLILEVKARFQFSPIIISGWMELKIGSNLKTKGAIANSLCTSYSIFIQLLSSNHIVKGVKSVISQLHTI